MSGSSRVHYLLLAINSGTFGNSNLVAKLKFFLWNSRLSILGTVKCLIGQFCRIRFEFKNTPINSPIEMMQFQRIHRLTNESLFLVVFVATSSGQIQPRIDFNKLLFANVPELIRSNKYAFLNGSRFPPRIRWGPIQKGIPSQYEVWICCVFLHGFGCCMSYVCCNASKKWTLSEMKFHAPTQKKWHWRK